MRKNTKIRRAKKPIAKKSQINMNLSAQAQGILNESLGLRWTKTAFVEHLIIKYGEKELKQFR